MPAERSETPRTPRLFPLLLAAALAGCATDIEFTVNTTEDLHDLDPGDGVCGTNDAGSVCSLRAAVEEANETLDSLRIQITVPPGNYELTLAVNGGLTLTQDRTRITGAGRTATIVDGLDTTRLFTITGDDATQIVIENLSLINGQVLDLGSGGAVFIQSDQFVVTFDEVRIADNQADFQGGGIYASGSGVLNVLNSTVEDNLSSACTVLGGVSGGGGIYSQRGVLNVIQSEVRGNCGVRGGGVRIVNGGRSLILRSTIASNEALDDGAGLTFAATEVRVEDSTIALNRVVGGQAERQNPAGAVLAIDSELEILSTTITRNENEFEAANGAGGIVIQGGSGTLRNTVLSDNHFFGNRECLGALDSDGGNLLDLTDSDDCDFDALASDTTDGEDPGVGSLGNNGGPTRTMRPTASSPLIDAGVAGCEDIDQRGLDFPAPQGAACDIGAIER